MYYFSAVENAFYLKEWEADYIKSGSWPADAKAVSEDVFTEFAANSAPAGKVRGVKKGEPVWVDIQPPTAEEIAAQKAEFVAQAKLKKSKLISDASDRIEILKDRIEAGQDKAAELKLWKSYRIALDDIDVSAAPDIEWPVAPE